MATFDSATPFLLLARIHVKTGCVDDYLELARETDAAVEASEPGMLHHTFEQVKISKMASNDASLI